MNALPAPRRVTAAEEVARLRAKIERIERTNRSGTDARVLPAPAAVAGLLPGGGLRTGAAYALDRSMPLLLGLLAEPSKSGTWCAAIGIPELGAEAASAAGAALDRLALIPRPGDRWLSVVATVAEVMGLVVVRPGGRVREQDAARLAARLRERGTVLLVQGPWPQVEARIGVESARWVGLGDGHGHLQRLEATVTVSPHQSAGTRRRRAVLLGQAGGPEQLTADTGLTDTGLTAAAAATAALRPRETVPDRALRAVG